MRLLASGERERVPETGAVASVQEAELSLPAGGLAELWRADALERLAAAYWRHITRATLGLVRVAYGPDSPEVVLLTRPLTLLRFDAPEYETAPGYGMVTWRIARGLLVARAGRGSGYLRIRVWRCDEGAGGESRCVRVRLEVRNFYPWLRGGGRFARLGAWLYAQTQLRIHVAVCNSFLRSLARLLLPRSRVGRLAAGGPGTGRA